MKAADWSASGVSQGWQVSANISLNRDLNRFKLLWQSSNLMFLHHHVHYCMLCGNIAADEY